MGVSIPWLQQPALARIVCLVFVCSNIGYFYCPIIHLKVNEPFEVLKYHRDCRLVLMNGKPLNFPMKKSIMNILDVTLVLSSVSILTLCPFESSFWDLSRWTHFLGMVIIGSNSCGGIKKDELWCIQYMVIGQRYRENCWSSTFRCQKGIYF
jgi:hypothetical protein